MKRLLAVAGLLVATAWLASRAIPVSAAGGDTPPVAAAGLEIYNAKCAMCHGKDGVAKPMAKGSANLNDPEWQKKTSVEQVAKVIAEGKGKMPKLAGKLTPEQITAVAEYTLTLK